MKTAGRRAAIRFMTAEAPVFVDTNVLIYARDEAAAQKRIVAVDWLRRLVSARRMIVNLQVLNELTRWVLRNEKVPLSVARSRIEELRRFGEGALQPSQMATAWAVRERLGYQWFDCLLVAAAVEAGCTHFLSEDMGHETRYGSLTIINPFRVSPETILGKN